MAAITATVLKLTGQSGAWSFVPHTPIRFIPSGTGWGTFAQTSLDWPLLVVTQSVIDELIDNFGQGPDFV